MKLKLNSKVNSILNLPASVIEKIKEFKIPIKDLSFDLIDTLKDTYYDEDEIDIILYGFELGIDFKVYSKVRADGGYFNSIQMNHILNAMKDGYNYEALITPLKDGSYYDEYSMEIINYANFDKIDLDSLVRGAKDGFCLEAGQLNEIYHALLVNKKSGTEMINIENDLLKPNKRGRIKNASEMHKIVRKFTTSVL